LPDAIETPDALFEQFGVVWQIKEHEMMGKLKVAALAADLEQSRIRAPSSSAKKAALRSRWRSVNCSWKSATATFTSRCKRSEISSTVSRFRQMSSTFARQFFQEGDEPFHFRRHGSFVFSSSSGTSKAWRWGKPDSAARVLRNITRPVPNSSSKSATKRRARLFVAGEQFFAAGADARGFLPEDFAIRRLQRLAVDQAVDGLGHMLVVIRFLEENLQALIAIRVQEAQASEVAFRASCCGVAVSSNRPRVCCASDSTSVWRARRLAVHAR